MSWRRAASLASRSSFWKKLDGGSRHLQLSHPFLVDLFYSWVPEAGPDEFTEGGPVGVSVSDEVVVLVVGIGGI